MTAEKSNSLSEADVVEYTAEAVALSPQIIVMTDKSGKVLALAGGLLSRFPNVSRDHVGEHYNKVRSLPIRKHYFRQAQKGESFFVTAKIGDYFYETHYIPQEERILIHINDVTERIQLEHEMDHKLMQKNREIKAIQIEQLEMLDNMRQAVLTIDKHLFIGRSYSRYLHEIFKDGVSDFSGVNMIHGLLTNTDLGIETMRRLEFDLQTVFGADSLQWMCSSSSFPKQLVYDPMHRKKTLKINFYPIYSGGDTVNKVMVVIEDITALQALQKKASERQQELEKISDILSVDESVFNAFMLEARRLVKLCREELQSLQEQGSDQFSQTMASLFRYIHTLKGSSGLFNLSKIQNAAHEVENEFTRLVPGEVEFSERVCRDLIKRIDYIENEVESYQQLRTKILKTPTNQGYYKFSDSHVGWLLTIINRMTRTVSKPLITTRDVDCLLYELRGAFSGVGKASLKYYFTRFEALVAKLAFTYKKQLKPLVIESQIYYLERNILAPLSDTIVLLLSNAMTHGIELPQQREQAGKQVSGLIQLRIYLEDGQLVVIINDDGAGIDPDKIGELARERGLVTSEELEKMSDEDKRHLIFASGFTSKKDADLHGGRGVGMDAVRKMCEDMGGEVHTMSEVGQGTTFMLTLPYENVSVVHNWTLLSVRAVVAEEFTQTDVSRLADKKFYIYNDALAIRLLFQEVHALLRSCDCVPVKVDATSHKGQRRIDSYNYYRFSFNLPGSYQEFAGEDFDERFEALRSKAERLSCRIQLNGDFLDVNLNSNLRFDLSGMKINIIQFTKGKKTASAFLTKHVDNQFGIRDVDIHYVDEWDSTCIDDSPMTMNLVLIDEEHINDQVSKVDMNQVVCLVLSRHPEFLPSGLDATLGEQLIYTKLPLTEIGAAQIMELAFIQYLSKIHPQAAQKEKRPLKQPA